jgi:predicted metal-binding protein
MLNLETFVENISERYHDVAITHIQKDSLVFEQRVKLNCFYCNRYGINWKCPPHIPELDYKALILEYENACFVHKEFPFSKASYETVRHDSSVHLHKVLLGMEEYLFSQSISMCVSFIGGSCKLCKDGCGKEKCENPYQARIPLEATGMNIVESALRNGIDIRFPVVDRIVRIGMILW